MLDPDARVLLFRYVHTGDALAGQDYWATPGGAVEAGETFEDAARRELWEETGIAVDRVGPELGHRHFTMRMETGEDVRVEERYFLVRVADDAVSDANWIGQERVLVKEHRWWAAAELATTDATIWPEQLLDMLATAARPA